jgi:cytidine deaminase
MTTLELSDLLAAAVKARDRAYAPYSHFAVGAAVRAPDGRVFTGANAENASLGLSMCAERVAIYHALSEGVRQFEAVGVAGPDGMLAMPCGACRQVLHEFGPGMQVVFDGGGGLRAVPLQSLLPEAFVGETLEAFSADGVAGREAR